MKIVLILFLCSMQTGTCLPPYQWPTHFEDPYSCSIAGYEESARKLKEMGRDLVNESKASVTFICREIPETI
tara:strand:- start:20 stop:235 length:216 start_codon:yes stop_codon:yes gene_type:complete